MIYLIFKFSNYHYPIICTQHQNFILFSRPFFAFLPFMTFSSTLFFFNLRESSNYPYSLHCWRCNERLKWVVSHCDGDSLGLSCLDQRQKITIIKNFTENFSSLCCCCVCDKLIERRSWMEKRDPQWFDRKAAEETTTTTSWSSRPKGIGFWESRFFGGGKKKNEMRERKLNIECYKRKSSS